MNIDSILLSKSNKLVEDYVQTKGSAIRFFHYPPYEWDSYHARLKWLQTRSYPHREQLADGLLAYNRRVGNDQRAIEQIETLRKPGTVVVIGGQQAGVLTGPLYTIHKAVSLIQTASRLQRRLGVEVVPVFWIAGEDHDLDEINHAYSTEADGKLVKYKLSMKKAGKGSASHLQVEKEQMIRFVKQFFADQLETVHTPKLREMLTETANQSETLVDWFARLMAFLFGKHGLVLVESSLPFIRELEKAVFQEMVSRAEQIQQILASSAANLQKSGYVPQLQLDERQAHLFVYHNNERLLIYQEEGRFFTKHRELVFTREELLQQIETNPARFSANVVSRPLAQEHIFPTLAFIGGPGEIAYWAYFKTYFAELGYQLPIVLPRTSITLLDSAVKRCMAQFDLDLKQVLQDFSSWKRQFVNGLIDPDLSDRFIQTKNEILALYRPLVEQVVRMDPGMKAMALKNLQRLEREITFLESRSKQSQINKHEIRLKRLDRIETSLLPFGKLQERVHNAFSFLNLHGLDLIDRIVAADFGFDPAHKVFYI